MKGNKMLCSSSYCSSNNNNIKNITAKKYHISSFYVEIFMQFSFNSSKK